MLNQNKIYSIVVGLFFIALSPNNALAQKLEAEITTSTAKTSKFQKIEQPIELKLAVALGGFSLIGAELWWFVFSKKKSQESGAKKTLKR